MTIQPAVVARLSDPVFRRTDPVAAEAAFQRLAVAGPNSFREFYLRYEGPFSSRRSGFELLDLCIGAPTITSMTEECRARYGFPSDAIVLTDLFGGSVLVLTWMRDLVFNVDFEGGDRDFVLGRLEPQWSSFDAFLNSYFST